MRVTVVAEQYVADLHGAARGLRRSWGFTLAAAGTLAVGIGATAALVAVADAVVFRPLPFAAAERLVIAGEGLSASGLARNEVSFLNARDWQTRARAFDGTALMGAFNWTAPFGADDPVAITYRAVSGEFFALLGTGVAVGRTLEPRDDRPGAPRVVVLEHGFWTRQFGADPAVVGRAVRLGEAPATIVGVIRPGLVYPPDVDAWVALTPGLADVQDARLPNFLEQREAPVLHVLARLGPGVTAAAGRQDLDRVIRELAAEHGRARQFEARLTPLDDVVLGASRPSVLALLAAVVLLLLVVSANVGGLMLVRSAERRRERALRVALGAPRRRLALQALCECAIIAGLGTVGALTAAAAGLPLLLWLLPDTTPRLDEVAITARVMVVTALAAGTSALVCWLAPLGALAGPTLDAPLDTLARGAGAGAGPGRGRRAVVAVQVGAAVVLVVLSGLLYRSVARLEALDLGFDVADLLAVEFAPPRALATSAIDEVRRFQQSAIDTVAALPLVASVAGVRGRPLQGPIGIDSGWRREDQSLDDGRTNPFVNTAPITPGYFATMRTPLVRGRVFDHRDQATTDRVVVVSASLARLAWPDQSPIGQRLRVAALGADLATVVGVVADMRYRDLRAPTLDVYAPMAQSPHPVSDLVVRTRGPAALAAPGIRAALRDLSPGSAATVAVMTQVVERERRPWRANLAIVAAFAAVTVLLAVLGVYAMLAAMVTERTREFGVRLALGATPGRIVLGVVADGGRVAAVGIVIGVVAALGVASVARSLLFEVSPTDPLTLTMAPLALLAAALVAAALPAVWASRADPAITLREG
jgi:predicted permease